MRAVKFPSQGTVFDYFIDSKTKKLTPWREKLMPFELEPDVPLQVCSYEGRASYKPNRNDLFTAGFTSSNGRHVLIGLYHVF